jgi:hypothetical protein
MNGRGTTGRRTVGARPARFSATVLLSALVATGCAAPADAIAEPTAEAWDRVLGVGRSNCADAVPSVLRRVDGAAADAVEALQGAYEKGFGFMSVVHDGVGPVIVVDRAVLREWRAEMAPHSVAVAASCVDSRLVAAVLAALPRAERPMSGASSAGYDALDDAIVVRGIEAEHLLVALGEVAPEFVDAPQTRSRRAPYGLILDLCPRDASILEAGPTSSSARRPAGPRCPAPRRLVAWPVLWA